LKKIQRDFFVLAGGLSEIPLAPNHHKDAPPTIAIIKIKATIAARNAILRAFFKTKKVIAATTIKKVTKTIAAISIL